MPRSSAPSLASCAALAMASAMAPKPPPRDARRAGARPPRRPSTSAPRPPVGRSRARLCRLGDGLVHATEAVDQAELAGGAAVPHAALGDAVDFRRRLAPRLRDDAEKAAVNRFHRCL